MWLGWEKVPQGSHSDNWMQGHFYPLCLRWSANYFHMVLSLQGPTDSWIFKIESSWGELWATLETYLPAISPSWRTHHTMWRTSHSSSMLESQSLEPEEMTVALIVCFTVHQRAKLGGLKLPGSALQRTFCTYCHVLASSYFSFGCQVYQQTGKMVMATPLSRSLG